MSTLDQLYNIKCCNRNKLWLQTMAHSLQRFNTFFHLEPNKVDALEALSPRERCSKKTAQFKTNYFLNQAKTKLIWRNWISSLNVPAWDISFCLVCCDWWDRCISNFPMLTRTTGVRLSTGGRCMIFLSIGYYCFKKRGWNTFINHCPSRTPCAFSYFENRHLQIHLISLWMNLT